LCDGTRNSLTEQKPMPAAKTAAAISSVMLASNGGSASRPQEFEASAIQVSEFTE